MNQISSSLNDKNITWVLSLLVYTLSFSKYVYTSRQSRFKSLQSEEVTETAQDRTVSRQNLESQPVSGYNTRSPWFWTSHEIWPHWLDENTKQILISWAYKANEVQPEVAFPKPLRMRNLLISKNELTLFFTKLSHQKANWRRHVSIGFNQIHTCSRRGSFSSSSWVMPYREGFLSILI